MIDLVVNICQKWMMCFEGMFVMCVIGVCDMCIVYFVLEVVMCGDEVFWVFVVDIVCDKGVLEVMVLWLIGVLKLVLLELGCGVQFILVGFDFDILLVCLCEEMMFWQGLVEVCDVELVLYVYGQEWVCDMFLERFLKDYIFMVILVFRNGEDCYYLCIFELFRLYCVWYFGSRYYDLLYLWEDKYFFLVFVRIV